MAFYPKQLRHLTPNKTGLRTTSDGATAVSSGFVVPAGGWTVNHVIERLRTVLSKGNSKRSFPRFRPFDDAFGLVQMYAASYSFPSNQTVRQIITALRAKYDEYHAVTNVKQGNATSVTPLAPVVVGVRGAGNYAPVTGTIVVSVDAVCSAGTLTYQWKKGGSNISGATAATYSKTGIIAGDAGTYTCEVTATRGGVTAVVTSPNIVVTVS